MTATHAAPTAPISAAAIRAAGRSCNGWRTTAAAWSGAASPMDHASTERGPAKQTERSRNAACSATSSAPASAPSSRRCPADWLNLGLQDPRITGSNDPITGTNDPATSWFDLPLKSGGTIRLRGAAGFVSTRGRRLYVPAEPPGNPISGVADDVSSRRPEGLISSQSFIDSAPSTKSSASRRSREVSRGGELRADRHQEIARFGARRCTLGQARDADRGAQLPADRADFPG